MNKEEILNDDFFEKLVQPKSHKKLKISLAIVSSIAIIVQLLY